MTSNFSFIPTQWAKLAQAPQEAEQHVYAAPMYAAMLLRKSLEEWVRWMYEHDEDLTLPYDKSLSSLIHEQAFKNVVAPMQFSHINLIRKLGNNAVHANVKIKPEEVLHNLKLLHGFIGWVTMMYSEERPPIKPFNESIIPKETGKDKTKAELQNLELAFHSQQTELKKLQDELATIKALKVQNSAFVPPPIDPNEDLTRKIYIDTLLREAGWDPFGFNVPEFPVKNCMPQANGSNGDGKVDYVLWGDDGKPLAVVEAKRTSRDPRVGQHQAKCYADCLQKEYGQRPVIFYTNGFQTWMWDDLNYAPREVYGFYTKDELQTLIQRRVYSKPLSSQKINDAITDRYYQHEAIRKVAEVLELKHRQALLVMATGTGKTRVSASMIDFLSKANWVKRVLFLADRNALIHQAKINLNEYLPNLPSVDLTKEKEDESSRIVFSTYQTMINMIDGEADGDNRFTV
jgi:type I restriction enzyme, R subunit